MSSMRPVSFSQCETLRRDVVLALSTMWPDTYTNCAVEMRPSSPLATLISLVHHADIKRYESARALFRGYVELGIPPYLPVFTPNCERPITPPIIEETLEGDLIVD